MVGNVQRYYEPQKRREGAGSLAEKDVQGVFPGAMRRGMREQTSRLRSEGQGREHGAKSKILKGRSRKTVRRSLI